MCSVLGCQFCVLPCVKIFCLISFLQPRFTAVGLVILELQIVWVICIRSFLLKFHLPQSIGTISIWRTNDLKCYLCFQNAWSQEAALSCWGLGRDVPHIADLIHAPVCNHDASNWKEKGVCGACSRLLQSGGLTSFSFGSSSISGNSLELGNLG